MLVNATSEWSAPITLTSAEIWQARSWVFITTATPPESLTDGIEMQPGDAIRFASGQVLRHRSAEPGAQIIRIPVL